MVAEKLGPVSSREATRAVPTAGGKHGSPRLRRCDLAAGPWIGKVIACGRATTTVSAPLDRRQVGDLIPPRSPGRRRAQLSNRDAPQRDQGGTGMLHDIQYRLLRLIAPTEPNALSPENYNGKSKSRVLLGDAIIDELQDKVVIDFGCGTGDEAIDLARSGVARVIGVDVRESVLEQARIKADKAGVGGRVTFTTRPDQPADAIVSLDGFEHFERPGEVLDAMYELLKPGGFMVTSFGPTWYHPLGGHLFSMFPWAHLVFSERALIRWRNHIRDDGATRFREVDGGLNSMTIARFERLVADSKFDLDYVEPVPIRKLRRLHNRITREFTTAIVRSRMAKPAVVDAPAEAIPALGDRRPRELMPATRRDIRRASAAG